MTQNEPNWITHNRAAEAALRQGDLATAEAALAAGFAAVGAAEDGSGIKAPVALVLVRVDWLIAAGREDEAEVYLNAQRIGRPEAFWLWYKAANLSLNKGDLPGAWENLATGLALDSQAGRPGPRMMAARMWQAENAPERAAAILRSVAKANPADVQSLVLLGQVEAGAGRHEVAAGHLEEARRRAPERADLVLQQGSYLTEAGRAEAAIAAYEAFEAAQGVHLPVTRRRLNHYRGAGQAEQATDALAKAVGAHPTDPALLREMFRIEGKATEGTRMAEVLVRLDGRIPTDLHAEFSVQLHLARLEFPQALALLRRHRCKRRESFAAHQMAAALIGSGAYELGLRYLRFCLRRWPGPGFLSRYSYEALRLGRIDRVAALLADPDAGGPARVRHSLRFTLAGYREDFETVQREFEALERLGVVTEAQRMQLAKMIFIWLDPAETDAFFKRIEHPFARIDKPLHRGGLPGQMMQEFELERRALPQEGPSWPLMTWMQERPGSTMAAIRLVDAWRAGEVPLKQDEGEPIPRRIWQYWDAPEPPGDVGAAFATWQAAPGFDYTRMHRGEALAYLRDHFEPGFVQAFRLAQNSAQEADFLRLCILSREGGVWADADDRLYGKIETVLGAARGLILYREPLGSALGNNFLAAPPGHPVIRHAARLASMALRRRDNETTWSKTGPGLLTRAVGHYLARKEPGTEGARITVLNWADVARHVGMHNDMPYKRTAAHWTEPAPTRHTPVWETLLTALPPAADPAAETEK